MFPFHLHSIKNRNYSLFLRVVYVTTNSSRIATEGVKEYKRKIRDCFQTQHTRSFWRICILQSSNLEIVGEGLRYGWREVVPSPVSVRQELERSEVGSESAGNPEKAAEQSVEGTQPTECVPESAVKEVEETAQPNRLRSQVAIPTAAKGSWSRLFSSFFLPAAKALDDRGGESVSAREIGSSFSVSASTYSFESA